MYYGKPFCIEVTTDVTGLADVTITVPTGGRIFTGVQCFVENPSGVLGDRVYDIVLELPDNSVIEFEENGLDFVNNPEFKKGLIIFPQTITTFTPGTTNSFSYLPEGALLKFKFQTGDGRQAKCMANMQWGIDA